MLGTYKKFLRLAERIPDSLKREKTLKKIKKTFKNNAKETDEIKVGEMMEKAESQLSFLKMTTPRDLREKISGRYVVEEGKFVSNEKPIEQKMRVVGTFYRTGDRVGADPDDIRRHEYLLRRMRFQEEPKEKEKVPFVSISDV